MEISKVKHIIILGPPGSGKGTQSKIIQDKFGLLFFSTGDLMRQEAKKGTEIGQKFQAVWDRGKGELIPDDLVDTFINQELHEINLSKGIIFDGYPRTIKQAENLALALKTDPQNIIVVNIQVPRDLLISRMQTRKVCSKCGKIFLKADQRKINQCDQCGSNLIQRQEDQPDTIKKRIDVYEKQTQPLIDYYKKNGRLLNIDGAPSIDTVAEEIIRKLKVILE